jgi:transcriptional regulator with XRE-family HTH domain
MVAMQTRSKARFKALRESVGLTQAALAAELGVEVRSVKRWESTVAPQQAPDDAWAVLGECKAQQERIIEFATRKVLEIAEEEGSYPHSVEVSYWMSESDYLQWSTDADNGIQGDWRMANANSRAVAAVLESHGIDAVFVDGSGLPGRA